MRDHRDILFPLNILGNKRRVFAVNIPNTATRDGMNYKSTIEWQGEYLQVLYTTVVIYSQMPHIPRKPNEGRPAKLFYDTGGTETITTSYTTYSGGTNYRATWMYIACTGVQELTVNGNVLLHNGDTPDPHYFVQLYADELQPILGVHNPEEPDQSLPETDNIFTYYADELQPILGVQ